jgi:hypothetical protein
MNRRGEIIGKATLGNATDCNQATSSESADASKIQWR